jgi:hypothetical protein
LTLAIFDTLPVYTSRPVDDWLQRELYHPKYKHHVWKVMIGCDFLGRILFLSGISFVILANTKGPHYPHIYNAHIYQNDIDCHPCEPWELHLGDGHFSCIPQFLCPYPQPPNGSLSADQLMVNSTISHYRIRVEHVNHRFNSFGIWHQNFRHSIQFLSECIKVIGHTINYDLCTRLKYQPVGPWAHY